MNGSVIVKFNKEFWRQYEEVAKTTKNVYDITDTVSP